jgi:AraC family transcriptional regulator
MARIDRVVDYVRENLRGDLSLDALARIACFSPYHFHRLFRSLTGETLNEFVRRARVERAAAILRSVPDRSLSSVAAECGFGSLATFSRAFKERYGMPPGRWDRVRRLQVRKIEQADADFPVYAPEDLEAMAPRFPVRIVSLPPQRIAYVRTLDSYAPGAFERTYRTLVAWVDARALPPGRLLTMSHDDPDVTPAGRCRLDVARTIPDGLAEERTMRFRTLPAMRVACAPCRGELARVHEVWEFLYRYWLPRSRYEPCDLPAMEHLRTRPEEWSRTGVVDLEAWIPVEPLRVGL